LEKATTTQRKILDKYYGKGKLTLAQNAGVKKVFVETGSLAYSQQKAEQYIDLGKGVIPLITKDKVMQELLREFVELVIKRRK
jgi:geranylgeranyl pyrophosphate synthase